MEYQGPPSWASDTDQYEKAYTVELKKTQTTTVTSDLSDFSLLPDDLKKPFYPYCFTSKITPLSLMIFFSKLLSLYSFPTFCGRALESLLPAANSTGSTQEGPSRHN